MVLKKLKSHREGWSDFDEIERQLLKGLTTEQGADQFLDLYLSFLPSLDETEKLFRPEKEAFLIEFQNRLLRLKEPKRESHAGSFSGHLPDSKPA